MKNLKTRAVVLGLALLTVGIFTSCDRDHLIENDQVLEKKVSLDNVKNKCYNQPVEKNDQKIISKDSTASYNFLDHGDTGDSKPKGDD